MSVSGAGMQHMFIPGITTLKMKHAVSDLEESDFWPYIPVSVSFERTFSRLSCYLLALVLMVSFCSVFSTLWYAYSPRFARPNVLQYK